jgi:hypothetical protein
LAGKSDGIGFGTPCQTSGETEFGFSCQNSSQHLALLAKLWQRNHGRLAKESPPSQAKPSQAKPNQTKPNQTKQNKTKTRSVPGNQGNRASHCEGYCRVEEDFSYTQDWR